MLTLSSVSRPSLKSGRFAPATATPRGTPAPSVSRLRFVPRLARSVGLGPVFSPTQRRFRQRAVEGLPLPLDPREFVVSKQAAVPEFPEHSRLGPFLEAAVGTALGAEAGGGQRIPLAAGAQHEENGVHGGSVVHPRVMTTERVGLSRRNQRLDLCPKIVRDAPPIVVHDQSHGSTSFPGIATPGKYPNRSVLNLYWDRL